MSDLKPRWHTYRDRGQLADAVAGRIVSAAAQAISTAGQFIVVLAGGSTPRPVYVRLTELDIDWDQWHVYFGDERCLPVSHPARNDTMIRDVLLNKVSVPKQQIHAIPAELGPDAGAKRYSRTLAGVASFDLTILGLGEDGHTASLFPGGPLGDGEDAQAALAVHAAPKPPVARVSLSAARLTWSKAVFLIATGEEKRKALTQLRDGAAIPIRRIVSARATDVFLDQPASPRPRRQHN